MESIIDQIAVSDGVRSALLGEDGPLAEVLKLAIELEQPADRNDAAPVVGDVIDAYRCALRWTSDITTGTLS